MAKTNIVDTFIKTLYNFVSTWIHKTLLVFTILCFYGYHDNFNIALILILYLMTFFNIHFRHYRSYGRYDKRPNFAHTNTVVLFLYFLAYITIGFIYFIVTESSGIDLVLMLCTVVNAILYAQPIFSRILTLLKKVFCKLIKNPYDNAAQSYKIAALYRQGDNLFKQEKYFEAIEVYEEAALESKKAGIQISPYNYYAIAMAYLGLKEYNNAHKSFKKVVKDNNTQPKLFYAVAEVYAVMTDWANTYQTLNELLAKLDKNSREYAKCQKIIKKYEKQQYENNKEQRIKRAKELYKEVAQYKKKSQYKDAERVLIDITEILPENEDYKKELSEVRQLYEVENKKFYDIYATSMSLKNGGNLDEALNILDNAYKIAEKQKINTTDIDYLKADILSTIDCIKKAEDLFRKSIEYKKKAEYANAVEALKNAINLNTQKEEYKNLLDELQPLLNEQLAKMDELYNHAVNLKIEKQYQQSLDTLQKAFDILRSVGCSHKDNKLDALKIELDKIFENLKKAESLYNQGQKHVKDCRYSRAKDALSEAVSLNPDKSEYKEFLDKIEDLYNNEKIRLQNLYEEAVQQKLQRNYDKALELLAESSKIAELQALSALDINNLKSEIDNILNNLKKAERLYNETLKYKNKNKYKTALEKIKKVQNLVPDNEIYNTAFNEIKELFDNEKNRLYELCNKVEGLKNNRQYNEALDVLNEAFKIAAEQEFSDNEPKKIKAEIEGILNNIQEAEKIYTKAINQKNKTEFANAIETLKEALKLDPDNETYEADLSRISPMLEAERERMENLLKKAQSLKEEGECEQALDMLEDVYNIADKQNFPTDKADILNIELTNIFEDLKAAEEFYTKAKKLLDSKNYPEAIEQLKNALDYAPKNSHYAKVLDDVKQEWRDMQANAKDSYEEAKYYLKQDDIEKAFESIDNAIALVPGNKSFKKLKTDIENRKQFLQDEKAARDAYCEALVSFEEKKYKKAISQIEKAIELNNLKTYTDLKKQILKEQKQKEDEEKALALFNSGEKAFNDGDFTKAVNDLTKACRLDSTNEKFHKLLEKAQLGCLDIMTCTEEGLLSIGFDDELAESIIQAREEGRIWYDYNTFVEDFEIKPHIAVEMEEKISFPCKPSIRYGRTLDF